MIYWNLSLASFLKELLLGPGFFVLAMLVGILMLFFSNRRILVAGYFVLVAAAFGIYASTLPAQFFGSRLQGQVQDELKQPSLHDCASTWPVVVVLGAGFASETTPSFAATARLDKALDILRLSRVTPLTIVVSGGQTDSRFPASEGGIGVAYLRHAMLGANLHANVLAEDTSLNTYQNAVATKLLIEQLNLSKKIILVSAGFHLPRAAATFRKQGFEVCPIGVAEKPSATFISFANAIETYGIINELAGYFGYWLKGWI